MEFNVYDMLVITDENDNIYQDCVCGITNLDDNKIIECNTFKFTVLNNSKVYNITNLLDNYKYYMPYKLPSYSLKEIWHRINDYTYIKVWKRED